MSRWLMGGKDMKREILSKNSYRKMKYFSRFFSSFPPQLQKDKRKMKTWAAPLHHHNGLLEKINVMCKAVLNLAVLEKVFRQLTTPISISISQIKEYLKAKEQERAQDHLSFRQQMISYHSIRFQCSILTKTCLLAEKDQECQIMQCTLWALVDLFVKFLRQNRLRVFFLCSRCKIKCPLNKQGRNQDHQITEMEKVSE